MSQVVPEIEIHNISFSYKNGEKDIDVLKSISLSVNPTNIVSIVGPSGCGKTTLIRLILGHLIPDSGEIKIKGYQPIKFRSEFGFGVAFQKPVLLQWRTIQGNLMLAAEIKAGSNKKALISYKKRTQHLLNIMGLNGFETSYPFQLSGGMIQRAAVARAMMTESKILFLDEPFSAVDEITRERLWVDFRELWKRENYTVVLVTHNIREAAFLSDTVYVMSKRPSSLLTNFDLSDNGKKDIDFLFSLDFMNKCSAIRDSLI